MDALCRHTLLIIVLGSLAMGIVSAAGSFGQFAMLPGTLGLLEWLRWSAALLVMGGLAALMVPLGGMLRDRPSPRQANAEAKA
ncbi:hypothetical protein M8009_00230 [Halomonas sp. ATCH28]|uniref:Uncharacterized protein n=1 Tax=Halomonas gemina TaxID=2945105 RepID=A0ABT0SVT7_9GAMM|nr:hypothetical protein [Halomonas gemina]MCL7938732.1 hypothetical protein [Halomonas gemina]